MLKFSLGLMVPLLALCLSMTAGMRHADAEGLAAPYDTKKLEEPAAGEGKKSCMQDSCTSIFGANLGFDVIFNTKDVFL